MVNRKKGGIGREKGYEKTEVRKSVNNIKRVGC